MTDLDKKKPLLYGNFKVFRYSNRTSYIRFPSALVRHGYIDPNKLYTIKMDDGIDTFIIRDAKLRYMKKQYVFRNIPVPHDIIYHVEIYEQDDKN